MIVCAICSLIATLCEKCPNTEFFLVHIFPHSDCILRDSKYFSVFSPNGENADHKKLRIWTHFTQCKATLTSFTFENVYQILTFISVGNASEDISSVHFTKVVSLRTKVDKNSLSNAAAMHFFGNTSLVLELNYQPIDP